tara:strand:+ start:4655 stop:5038 length:384 start_codon:yes stop_codon:yes gene_type:complete
MNKYLKSAGSVKIGRKFIQARNKLGMSLEEVKNITYINNSYIDAIEKGDYSVFPSETFARAYFKKYANLLKISSRFPGIYHQESKNSRIKRKIELKINKTFNENTYLFYVIVIVSSLVLISLFFWYI